MMYVGECVGESIDELGIGSLVIIRRHGGFTYGADAVALARFAQMCDGDTVLDIGTGTGIIPLLLCALTQTGIVTALDIQQCMIELASRSVELNALQNRIKPKLGDIREYRTLFTQASFSLITCNPPYIKLGEGKLSPSPQRAISRAEVCCTLADVVAASAYLLAPEGRACYVIPEARYGELNSLAAANALTPSRAVHMLSREGGRCVFVLAEYVNGKPKQVFSVRTDVLPK